MSYKYINLERSLKSIPQSGTSITLSFEEIEGILGFQLPLSARKYGAWWANQRDFSGRPQAQAWLSAGFEVDQINLHGQTVRFRPAQAAPPAPDDPAEKTPAAVAIGTATRPQGNSVVLISCVSQKLAVSAKAKDLYTSTLFRLNYAYAQKLQPRAIFILSAKYGLVSPDDMIEPYDMTLNTMSQAARRDWSAKILAQLRLKADIKRTSFVFLAGERYRQHLAPELPHHEVPLQGLTIGRQLQRLQEMLHD